METCSLQDKDFKLGNYCLKREGHSGKDCYAYAVTFAYNSKMMKDKLLSEQWYIFVQHFDQWKLLFLRRMNVMDNKDRAIISYEIYPEVTKEGTIHAHGIIYYTSNYYESISHIMAKAWVDKTRKYGNKLVAQRKVNHKGSYDYAFGKCNSIVSWRKYITKEHPRHYDLSPLLPERELTLSYNL